MTKFRVLIVDDERDVADSLCCILEKFGFAVRVAYAGHDGLETAREFLPELLLTDLSMPGMSGLTMASLIARELPACGVLMLTGDYHALQEAWVSSAVLFRKHSILTKPVHPDALLREARNLLHIPPIGVSAGVLLQ